MRAKATTLSLIVDFATFLAIFSGLLVTFFEYGDYQKEKSIDRALKYADINRAAGEGLADDLHRIEAFSLEHWNILSTFDPSISQDTVFDSEKFILERVSSDPPLKNSIARLTAHYDTLALCISEGLCDENISKALAESSLREFHNSTYPWLIYNIKNYNADAARPLICMHKHFQQSTDLKGISMRNMRGHICNKENRDKLAKFLTLENTE